MVKPTSQVVIVDEFTGRLDARPPLERWLHQAVEAKEGAEIQRERTRRWRTVTFQNYFRLLRQARRHDRHGR